MKNDVIICGGGLSVKKGINLNLWNKIRNKNIWMLNYGFLFLPYEPTILLWGDDLFYREMMNQIAKLKCKKYAKILEIYKEYKDIDNIEFFEWTKDKDNSNKIYIGENGLTGIFAISIAIKQQFKNIYLLGIDFNCEGTQTHWYQEEAKKIGIVSVGFKDRSVYLNKDNKPNLFIKGFDILVQRAAENNCKIYNVSEFSNLYQFEKISYEKFFELLKLEKS